MEPLDLLTIIGLIVAVYAILPKERLLDLRLRLNWIDWVAILLSVILLHYITFYPIFKSLNIAPDLGTWRWGFNPENISYLIILLTALFVWLHSRRARVRRSSILKFRELTERLLMEGKYSDLLFLLELHHNSLFKVYNLDFPISHIRNRLDPNSFGQAFISVHTKDFSSKLLGLLPMSLRKLLANFLPSWQKESEAAQDIVHRLLLSSSFISYLCEARPYFVLDLLKHQFHEKNGFLNLYVRGLLSNAHSVLYFEIQENQNLSSYSRYIIDEKNRFIHFFLADAEVANKAAIWKPFGDFTLERLDELWIDPNTDTYNQPIGTYRETDQWYCPIHATIQFFDIMIHEALFQGITWHMWLYYMPLIVKKIIRNLKPSSLVDLNSEWPTRYHFLLYEIVSSLLNWIRSAKEVPTDQENIVLKNENLSHENGNIPKSSVLALGQVLRYILLSSTVTLSFKVYILEIVLMTLKDLRNNKSLSGHARVLEKAIINGGFGYPDNPMYLTELKAAYDQVDIKLRFEDQEFANALNKA